MAFHSAIMNEDRLDWKVTGLAKPMRWLGLRIGIWISIRIPIETEASEIG